VFKKHTLTISAFMSLAVGEGDRSVIRELRNAQLSKHLRLLIGVNKAARAVAPPTRESAAFRAGFELLDQALAADHGAVNGLLALPQIGSWARHCLASSDVEAATDFGYLAGFGAAAAIRAGVTFEIEVPVTDGRVLFPGLGCLQVPEPGEWIRLCSDGERLRAGQHTEVACDALVPDDGSAERVPPWQGTPLVRAAVDGQDWEVLLETADKHLHCFTLPVDTAMTEEEVARWRALIQSGWELLVRHHDWAAGPVAEGVAVIVPLAPQPDLHSAAWPAAFGAIATSLPPSPTQLAETLIHEFQHVKLGALLDTVKPLVKASDQRGYAPWREDPRPMSGLLQGVYAFAGIARFWDVQRHIETEPDDVLRASVLYERWRSTIEPVTGSLLESGALTPIGVDFVTALRERGPRHRCGPVPAEAIEVAREVALDNQLTWQLRHTAVDQDGVADLAAAFALGEPLGDRPRPETRIEDDIRKVDSVARSRLLNLRFKEPRRYRQLSAGEIPELGPADALLIQGNAPAAIAAYREELAAEPNPATWIGLALAVHRLQATPSRSVFAAGLPLLFETHARLADRGVHADPLDVAAWFA
jgi:HEXXH motif-containing protein